MHSVGFKSEENVCIDSKQFISVSFTPALIPVLKGKSNDFENNLFQLIADVTSSIFICIKLNREHSLVYMLYELKTGWHLSLTVSVNLSSLDLSHTCVAYCTHLEQQHHNQTNCLHTLLSKSSASVVH